MRRLPAVLLAFTIWTYGNETMDILAEQSEWLWFQANVLQCELRGARPWCLVGDKWETL